MPHIVDDATWRKMTAELTAYRSTGLSPQQVMELAGQQNDPAPQPLPLNEPPIVFDDWADK